MSLLSIRMADNPLFYGHYCVKLSIFPSTRMAASGCLSINLLQDAPRKVGLR